MQSEIIMEIFELRADNIDNGHKSRSKYNETHINLYSPAK